MILCIQHVPFETPGFVIEWAKMRKKPLHIVHCYDEQPFPDISQLKLIVIMGGPMSVHDEKIYPWIVQEKQFIEKAIRAEKKIIGICLGAQLIADVMGAKVYGNAHREIGWFEVSKVPSKSIIDDILPDRFQAFHWHGETFDIPQGAERIAETPACCNQAFTYEQRILGMQFHLEITEEGVKSLLSCCAGEMTCGGSFVQNETEIINALNRIRSAHGLMNALLNRFSS